MAAAFKILELVKRRRSNQALKLAKKRRTYYNITKKSPISNDRIIDIVKQAVLHTPTSFNSQSCRAVVLFGADHEKLWDGVKECLKPLIPADVFAQTEKKVDGSFKAGYGTVLFFEDQRTVQDLQKAFPTYQEKFPECSEQSSGMLQHIVWTSLNAEGLGASLQHYSPVIDEYVITNWNVPREWKLIAQMPFGTPAGAPGEKTFKPIEERVKVFGA